MKPGATLTSRNHTAPVGVDDQVRAGQVAQAQRLVRGQRDPGALRRRARRRAARARRTRWSRRCSGRCSRRRRRRRGSRPRAGPGARAVVDDRHGDLDALDELLDQRDVAVGEGVDHRRRAAPRRSRTTEQPSAEPPLAGLTISGRPSRATSAAITAAAPSSRNVSCGRHTDAGVCTPARATTALATGLSKAIRQAAGRRADVGHAEQLEHLADRAVLAGLAVQHRHHAGRRVGGAARAAGRRRRRAPRPRARSPRSASATRRPERSETSRSWDRPPASTTTRPVARGPVVVGRGSWGLGSSAQVAARGCRSRCGARARGRARWRRRSRAAPSRPRSRRRAGVRPPGSARAWGSRTTAASSRSRSRRRRTRCRGRTRPAR